MVPQKKPCRRRESGGKTWYPGSPTREGPHTNRLCTSSKGRCRLGSTKLTFFLQKSKTFMVICSRLWVPVSQFSLLSSFSVSHSNTRNISYIQQEQTYYHAQLHRLKSTEHEGLSKKSVTIYVPADREDQEDQEQDQRWSFKQKVDSNYPRILLSGRWNLTYLHDSKASTSEVCKFPFMTRKKNCGTQAECYGSYSRHVGIVHQYVSTYTFRQVR